MRFSTITAAMLLPFIGTLAQSGTSTMTQASTQTVTVVRVVSTTTSTYGTGNSTMPYPTGTGAATSTFGSTRLISSTTSAGSPAKTSAYVGGASAVNGVGYGAAGILGIFVAAML